MMMKTWIDKYSAFRGLGKGATARPRFEKGSIFPPVFATNDNLSSAILQFTGQMAISNCKNYIMIMCK